MRNLTFLAIAACAAVDSASASCKLAATQAWSRVAASGRPMVGYVQLKNTGDTAVTITGARSTSFGAIELHETQTVDGVSRMSRLKSVEVPAEGSIALRPGGKHFMLFRAANTFKAGDRYSLTVLCEKAEQSIEFEVRETAPK
jgi:periplasmic copper chaperone A